jgi:hypothetical protein
MGPAAFKLQGPRPTDFDFAAAKTKPVHRVREFDYKAGWTAGVHQPDVTDELERIDDRNKKGRSTKRAPKASGPVTRLEEGPPKRST